MALKGNLLFNGDFETGTTEGWVASPYGLGCDCVFTTATAYTYRGSYSGVILCSDMLSNCYIGYNAVCSFEEYEAYLYIAYLYNYSMEKSQGEIYGLDDRGNLINHFALGCVTDKEVWKKVIALLRGFGDITHFSVGIRALSYFENEVMYFDEAKLIPLRSIKGHVLAETIEESELQYIVAKTIGLACIGSCRLTSILKVSNIQGDNPVLKTSLSIHLLDNPDTVLTYNHSDFTEEGLEKITIDLPEVSYIEITYNAGEDGDKFDIRHHFRLEPIL